MKDKKWLLFICIAIPLAIGGISAILTSGSMNIFGELNKPPLAPPGWLFPIVWTVLYTLMGISSYLVLISMASKEDKENAIKIYAYQLMVNFLWPTFFFNLELYLFSFFWLLFLIVLVVIMIIKFKDINIKAAYINIPYLIWLCFAAYLNLAIWIIN